MPITPTDTLRYERRDQKAYITLNRPESMNALNREITNAIGEAILDYEHDDDLLAAIIIGEGGRAFSAGWDLKQVAGDDAAGRDPMARTGLTGHGEVQRCAKPVIAAIDGYCLAAGLELALACDIRIATEASRFGLPEPRRSLLAGYGLHNLSRMIPLGEALHLQLTGVHITAERAYQIGLVQRLVADRDALLREADALADEILLCAPLAVQAIKKVVKTGRSLPPEYSQVLGDEVQARIDRTEDRGEGPWAFAAKRAPVWKSR